MSFSQQKYKKLKNAAKKNQEIIKNVFQRRSVIFIPRYSVNIACMSRV